MSVKYASGGGHDFLKFWIFFLQRYLRSADETVWNVSKSIMIYGLQIFSGMTSVQIWLEHVRVYEMLNVHDS